MLKFTYIEVKKNGRNKICYSNLINFLNILKIKEIHKAFIKFIIKQMDSKILNIFCWY